MSHFLVLFRYRANYNRTEIYEWIKNIKWTPTLAALWQEFYYNASRWVGFSTPHGIPSETLAALPKYKDLPIKSCQIGSV
jgi:hypothetical protein